MIVPTSQPQPFPSLPGTTFLLGTVEKSLKSALSHFRHLNSTHAKRHGLLNVLPSDDPVRSRPQFSGCHICPPESPLRPQVPTTDVHYLLDKCKHLSARPPGGSAELHVHLVTQSCGPYAGCRSTTWELVKKKKKMPRFRGQPRPAEYEPTFSQGPWHPLHIEV